MICEICGKEVNRLQVYFSKLCCNDCLIEEENRGEVKE